MPHVEMDLVDFSILHHHYASHGHQNDNFVLPSLSDPPVSFFHTDPRTHTRCHFTFAVLPALVHVRQPERTHTHLPSLPSFPQPALFSAFFSLVLVPPSHSLVTEHKKKGRHKDK